jgi:urease accessory protein UreE
LGQKEANDEAAEAEKKAAKLTEELALAKAQLQKERKRRVTENQEEVSISKPRKPSTSARKKAVSTVN